MKNRIKLEILKIIFGSKFRQNFLQIVATLATYILQAHIWNKRIFFFIKGPKCIENMETFSKGILCNLGLNVIYFLSVPSLKYCTWRANILWILTEATKDMQVLKVFSSYWYRLFKVSATITWKLLYILLWNDPLLSTQVIRISGLVFYIYDRFSFWHLADNKIFMLASCFEIS